MKFSKTLFVIVGIVVVLAVAIFLTINQKTESQTELEVNPQQICVDIIDMGFSSEQECVDFVNGMVNKIDEYSDLDCQKHAVLFKKLGINCP